MIYKENKPKFIIRPAYELFKSAPAEKNFQVSLASFSYSSLLHFVKELYTYSHLIRKATASEVSISIQLCNELAEAQSLEECKVYLEDATNSEAMVGIKFENDTLNFFAFASLNEDMQQAASLLLEFMVRSAVSKNDKKPSLKKLTVKTPENEKFYFRTWLIRLGWKGEEGKKERTLLYKNLEGNTAFCTPDCKTRWEIKRKQEKA